MIEPLINYDWKVFPKKELETLVAHQDEAILLLVDILKDYINNPDLYDGFGENRLHVVALSLLAHLKAYSAWPILKNIIRNFKCNEWQEHEYGDIIYSIDEDDVYKVYATLAAKNTNELQELALDESLDYIARTDCMLALKSCYFEGDLSRKELLDYLKAFVEVFQDYKDYETGIIFWFDLLCICTDVYAFEIAAVTQAFIPDEIRKDEMIQIKINELRRLNEADYDDWLENEFQQSKQEQGYIHDVIPYLEVWFEDEMEVLNSEFDSIFEKNCEEDEVYVRQDVGYWDEKTICKRSA